MTTVHYSFTDKQYTERHKTNNKYKTSNIWGAFFKYLLQWKSNNYYTNWVYL